MSILFFRVRNTNQFNLVESLRNNSGDLRMRSFYAPPLKALRPPLSWVHYLQYEPSDLKHKGSYFEDSSSYENFALASFTVLNPSLCWRTKN